MAFWTWANGGLEPEALQTYRSAKGLEPIGPASKPAFFLERRQIPVILARPDIQTALTLWGNYKRFGLPFGCGWAEHPAIIVGILSFFEGELGRWQADKREKDGDIRRAKAGHHRRG